MRTIEDYSIVGQPYALPQLEIKRKEVRALNIFWGGFTLYTGAYALYVTSNGPGLYRVEAIGLLLMLFGGIGAIRFRIENTYLKVVYTLYCSWLCLVIARG